MANKLMMITGRVAAGVAALSLAAAATTASADSRHYRHHDGRNGDVAAAAIAAGVIGLADGAALSDNDRGRGYYDDRRYYDQRRVYAPPRYGYGYGYAPRPYYGSRECWTTREYDRWDGRYYERTVCR